MAVTNNSRKHPKKDELSQLFLRYLPYWPYFLLSIIVCGLLAGAYLYFKTPVYQTSASILIKKNDSRSPNNNFISPMDVFSSQKQVENETAVLKSYSLMRNVVKKRELNAPIYIESNFLGGIIGGDKSGYYLSPVKIEIKNPDSIKVPDEENKIYFNYDGKIITIDGKKYPLNVWKNSPWGSAIKFVPNPKYKTTPDDENITMYFSLLTVNQAAHQLINNLGVSASSQMSTII